MKAYQRISKKEFPLWLEENGNIIEKEMVRL